VLLLSWAATPPLPCNLGGENREQSGARIRAAAGLAGRGERRGTRFDPLPPLFSL